MFGNAKNGSVPLGDTRMSYVSFGSGEKNLIILPGLSDGLATVKGKALLLAGPYRPFLKRYTVYMFSRKDDMPEGYSIRDMAADQARACEILGIRRTAVLGVSQGGMIAQCLAADFPERVEKLVIAVSAPSCSDMTDACVREWIRLAEAGDHKQLMIDTAEKSYSPEKLKTYRKLYPVLSRVGKPSDYGRFLTNARAILGFDGVKDPGRIICPALIIGGEEDRIVGAEASRELARMIPESTLYVYPGLGHAAYEEAPDFYRRVFDFLDRP